MTLLEWPAELPSADRRALRTELDSLIGQIIDEEMHALDSLDDKFARMAAALLALLDAHTPDEHGRCLMCPRRQSKDEPSCAVLQTIHEYLKQPLTLIWWHQFHKRGEAMTVDEIGAWIERSDTPHEWD